MANDNGDDTDVTDESSTDTSDDSGLGDISGLTAGDDASAQDTPGTAAPLGSAGDVPQIPGLGGDTGGLAQGVGVPQTLASTLQGGLSGGTMQPQMTGSQAVQGRHGGLLTGLAGLLIDGLAAGMAPDRQSAMEMPFKIQQAAAQQQQAQQRQQLMQMQQAKLQQELADAPLQEKMKMAQYHINMLHLQKMSQDMEHDHWLELLGEQSKLNDAAIQDGRATKLLTISVPGHEGMEQTAKAAQQIAQTFGEKGLNVTYGIDDWDEKTGVPTKYSVYESFPKGTTQSPHTYHASGGNGVEDKDLTVPAGTRDADEKLQVTNLYTDQRNHVLVAGQALARQQHADEFQKTYDQKASEFQQTYSFDQAKFRTESWQRQQGLSLQKENVEATIALKKGQEDLKAAQGEPLVQATDETGHTIKGTASELQAVGITPNKMQKMTQQQQNQTGAARELTDPDGLLALARQQALALQAKGKLGPIVGHWNNFWAQKGLDGDQQAFRMTLDYIGSKMMQAHLQRTSLPAMEHFATLIPENSTPGALFRELNEDQKYMQSQAGRPRASRTGEASGQRQQPQPQPQQ